MGSGCGGRASTLSLRFPLASERNARLVAEGEVQVFGFGEESAVGFGFENANGDDIAAWLDGVANGVDARDSRPTRCPRRICR